ncbi:MAG: glycoside hydrolase family 1 protein [Candidatus Obscuribacterales bacterium]|nr:glycoside hydrolase family 1 protein [Candidatus Obscuribacterales bacterium]
MSTNSESAASKITESALPNGASDSNSGPFPDESEDLIHLDDDLAGAPLEAASTKNFFHFPEGFLWGVATSHFQVEGHPDEIGNRLSDWAKWTEEEGRILDRSTADKACEFFSRYQSDIELCEQLNLNSFRLSLNWPAMCPGPGHVYRKDDETLAVYKDMLKLLKAKGFKTFVTLFHFCLPSWLAEIGGWNNEQSIDEFERFADFVAEELGEYVDFWLTLNEPLASVYQGYVAGLWPPGYQHNYMGGFECLRNLLRGHARAYKKIHTRIPNARVSVTHHWMSFSPRHKFNPFDHLVRHMRDSVFNHSFMSALHTGKLNFPWPASLDPRLRDLSGEIEGLAGSMDFIGINYYTRQFCEFEFKFPIDIFGVKSEIAENELSGLGWESYPQGLYNLLVHELKPYRYDENGRLRDIYITENGHANMYEAELAEGDWSLEDAGRIRYLVSHLMSLYRAITDGANVKGYLHWSLIDNFEWAEGLRARFGLVRVSYPTLQRTLRKSARIYRQIAGKNALAPHFTRSKP